MKAPLKDYYCTAEVTRCQAIAIVVGQDKVSVPFVGVVKLPTGDRKIGQRAWVRWSKTSDLEWGSWV